jgi:hypothetical protein
VVGVQILVQIGLHLVEIWKFLDNFVLLFHIFCGCVELS